MEIIKKPIYTKRLVIKQYEDSDFDVLTDICMNKEIQKTFMIPHYETREEYEALANRIISFGRPEDTKHLEYGIYYGDKLIGFLNDCGFNEEEIEIGYVIHPDYKGRGFATEALEAVLKQLEEMGFKKAKAAYFEENIASSRVMEKCGMKLNGMTEEIQYRDVTHKCIYMEILL